jgi:hypothetical protein
VSGFTQPGTEGGAKVVPPESTNACRKAGACEGMLDVGIRLVGNRIYENIIGTTFPTALPAENGFDFIVHRYFTVSLAFCMDSDNHSSRKVNLVSPQAQQFPLSQPRTDCDDDKGLQMLQSAGQY